jgi:hypothetical protein
MRTPQVQIETETYKFNKQLGRTQEIDFVSHIVNLLHLFNIISIFEGSLEVKLPISRGRRKGLCTLSKEI